MGFQILEADGVITIIPSSEIRSEEANRLEEVAMAFIEKGEFRFLIDLSNVKYLDSSALRVLIKLRKKVQEYEGTIVLRGLTGIVKELFEMTSLDQIFTIEK